MMKDDGPSPRVRISLTAASHRPCQFEHEITGPTEARVVARARDAAGWVNEMGSPRRARWVAGGRFRWRKRRMEQSYGERREAVSGTERRDVIY